MTGRPDSIPPAVLAYGLLGVVPFWLLPMAALLARSWTGAASVVEAAYAALILSFLGGARWGLAVQETAPNPLVVGLAMTPTLGGLAILILTHGEQRSASLSFAAALTLSWGWDCLAKGLPPWYARLRTGLTIGAVGGLCVGAWQVP